MKEQLLDDLVDPITQTALEAEVLERDGDDIVEGVLRSATDWYPISEGVPRVMSGSLRGDFGDFAQRHGLDLGADAPSRSQDETNKTFSDKWRRFTNYGFEPQHGEFLTGWYVEKLGVADETALQEFYRGKSRILELGPGSGFNTAYMAEHCSGSVTAVDISEAADTVYRNVGDTENIHVIQADLMNVPIADGTFDFAIADGVLHHTPSTRAAIEAVYQKLAPGGEFFFYVYRKMGAARYFVDQHIRSEFMPLDPDDCYDACQGITELGRELSALNATITLEHGIPALGIPAGTHDVQRLVYYNFMKCFWNDAFDWETNNMVNFDWYHPHDAWQQSEEEVREWVTEMGATNIRFNPSNPNGICCLIQKPE
ncbi:MAG: methyltransferase domain-containing protein [Actinomycetota bacterium]